MRHMNTAALYYRCSTAEQRYDSQMESCRLWCQINGFTPKEYTDTASGSTTSRKAFDEMMADVRAKRVQAVICYKLDRLGRSLTHLVQTVAEFEKYGVAFVCPSQGIDTRESNPGGRLQMHMLMAFAEFERSLIRERTKAGMRGAKDRGVMLGRKPGSKLNIPVEQWLTAQQHGASLRGWCRDNQISTGSLQRAVARYRRQDQAA